MESFKRISRNSMLHFIEGGNCDIYAIYDEEKNIFENNEYLILQIWFNEADTENLHRIAAIIEYIEREGGIQTRETTNNLKPDLDFQNYLETVINKDPFGAKYSGKMIKEVFLNGDKEWLDYALKNLKNEFIRERLKYIVENGGYGKIICK